MADKDTLSMFLFDIETGSCVFQLFQLFPLFQLCRQQLTKRVFGISRYSEA